MKNRFALLSVLALLLLVVLGCGLGGLVGSGDSESGSGDSSSTSDGSSDSGSSAGDLVKVGIPECDEFAQYINEQSETIGEDSWAARAIVEMYKQSIFRGLKESVEKMNDEEKAKMADTCKQAFENVKKQMEGKEK
ncbi:MAG: hypothetical protein J5I65_12610 [Aridibacter famidurans]|nr:hypothetical protein [Aridibacter famidurans]